MPELPEVETTRRGIAPRLTGQTLTGIVIRQRQLRWPVPKDLEVQMLGQPLLEVQRRAKYLLFKTPAGTALVHLGMSGSLRILTEMRAPGPHDHVDLTFGGGLTLRFTDPRRFGAVLWTSEPAETHPLLAHLGPEPLSDDFHAERLHARSRGRRASVKTFIMDARTVVGVGNIYASEALFRAGIHPSRPAGRISRNRYERLVGDIRDVLTEAIAQGGTTLRDFVDGDGQPGYFTQSLSVYGREGQACPRCQLPIRRRILGQRSTFFCPECQR